MSTERNKTQRTIDCSNGKEKTMKSGKSTILGKPTSHTSKSNSVIMRTIQLELEN